MLRDLPKATAVARDAATECGLPLVTLWAWGGRWCHLGDAHEQSQAVWFVRY